MSKMSVASGMTDAPEIPANLGLPSEYKPRRCRWCRTWSYMLCPWDQRGTVLATWHPLVPWHRGSKLKPSGEGCKVCVIVIWCELSRILFTMMCLLLGCVNIYCNISRVLLSVAKVWDQCFAARFHCPDRFAKAVEADPTIFHKFQEHISLGILRLIIYVTYFILNLDSDSDP